MIVIVGGGIAGLSAAWELQQRGIPYTLLETSSRLGGKIETIIQNGFLVEKAADAFILSKPYAKQLAVELGLSTEIIHPRQETKRLYFLKGGKLLDFPRSMKMFIPQDIESFRHSGVLSGAGTERFLGEVDIPPKQSSDDESLASFVIRRFGKEALNFVAPMAAGIYVANPHELSMQATFPQFLKMEQESGSLIRACSNLGSDSGHIFMSFKGGMSALVQALAEKLRHVRLNCPVASINANGVLLASGETIAATGIICAVPSGVAKNLLASFEDATSLVSQLKSGSSVAVALAYSEESLPFDMSMHGLLVDASEGVALKAITVHSSKLAGRAPKESVLLRCFFSGISEAQAYREAESEVARLFNTKKAPLAHWIVSYHNQNPSYQVGHLGHMSAIKSALPSSIKLVGASYSGVGIPDCVHSGREAAIALS